MKKIMIFCFLVLFLFFCVGCNSNPDFVSGTYFYKNWEEELGTYQIDAIPNKEVALNVAQAIFDGMEKSEETQGFVPEMVFYDEPDAVWIVTFGPGIERMLGSCYCIALQKSDGKVLRIWFEE